MKYGGGSVLGSAALCDGIMVRHALDGGPVEYASPPRWTTNDATSSSSSSFISENKSTTI